MVCYSSECTNHATMSHERTPQHGALPNGEGPPVCPSVCNMAEVVYDPLNADVSRKFPQPLHVCVAIGPPRWWCTATPIPLHPSIQGKQAGAWPATRGCGPQLLPVLKR